MTAGPGAGRTALILGHVVPLAPASRRQWAGLWVLAAALGMIVLDGTIVAVALPAMIADMGLDLTQAQWINSLYAVVFAALLLTAGRLGDQWGRRRMLLIGLGVFVLGSVLAALGGVLYAPISSIQPYMGHSILLLAFAVVIVGGMGKLRGTFVAAFALGMVMSVTARYWSQGAEVVVFIVMGVVLVFKPLDA